MTAAETPPETEALNFSRTPEQKAKDDPAARERVPFTLDDDPTILWAIKPKTAVLLNLGAVAARALEQDDQLIILALYDMFMDTVLDDDSAEYLRGRFHDPADSYDFEMLDPVMEALLGRWYRRPTGRQPASVTLPRTTGRRSTGTARSKAATR